MHEPFDEDGWDKDGWHLFHYAAYRGNVKELKALLDKRSEWVELETKGRLVTPLHLSARRGHLAAVALLLDKKANIDKQEDGGWTALMIAMFWDQQNCVRLLLERKANRSLCSTSGYSEGMTALELARYYEDRNEEIIAMLEAQPAPEAPPAPFPTNAGNGKIPTPEATSTS